MAFRVPSPHAAVRTAGAGVRSDAGALRRQCACGNHAVAGGRCEACKQKQSALQREPGGDDRPNQAAPVAGTIPTSGGRPLEPGLRARMEHRFDHDFSGVRVHTDDPAAHSADALRARAYTVGRSIVFAQGAFAPRSRAGERLITHELAHVVQNERRPWTGSRSSVVSGPDDASEREAHAAAHATGGGPVRITAAPAAMVQRASNGAATGFGIGAAILGAGLVGLGVAAAAGAFDKKPSSEPKEPSLLDDPAFRKRWEAGLEEGLKKLESAQPEGCRFPQGQEVAYDQENWIEITKGEEGKLGGRGFRAKTGDSFKAVELLFSRLDRWTCDCRLFGEIALLHAWWSALKDDKTQFNQRFANLTLRAEDTTGIKRKIVQPESAEFDDATWESAPVGSKVVWKNESLYAEGAWANEHAIKRSMAKPGQEATYAAQGVVTEVPAQDGTGATTGMRTVLNSTERQVKLEVARRCYGDFPTTFKITSDSIAKLKKDGVDDSTIKKIETIKDVPVVGRHKFLQQSIVTEINDGIFIQTTADQPHPKINRTVKLMVNHSDKKIPQDSDPLVTDYVNKNIKRFKIEIPT